MADIVVTFLLNYLSQVEKHLDRYWYLPQVRAHEANFSGGVKDEVNSIPRELINRLIQFSHRWASEIRSICWTLTEINTFLKSSEEKRNEHKIVKNFVKQSRDVAYEVEDVIDTFILDIAILGTGQMWSEKTHTKHTIMLKDVAMKIKNLSNEIGWKIYSNGEKYGIEAEAGRYNIEYFMELPYKRRREDELEDDVVGFDDHSTILVKQLTERRNQKLDVVSIIGMRGSGKTTLARKIYNNVGIKSHFNCRAWVSISQNFRTKEVLLEILKSEMSRSDELTRKKLFKNSSEDELKKKVFRCLRGRRYLIVLDDWRTEVWDEVLSSAFPDNSEGSRILITSCIEDASQASHTFDPFLPPFLDRDKIWKLFTEKKSLITSRIKKASHASHTFDPFLLPFLDRDKSWELFSKKIFRGTCPPELETLGKKIAEDCCGLPLSIVVLGGLLANKEKTPQAWSKLIGNTNRKCQDIRALIYTLLPLRLKPCFLYFGVYPEGFEIPVRRLMHQWVAEGFIEHTDNRDPEDVAEDYLEELIDQSLVQVASRRTDGGVKTCRIHALLRDFCISESAKEKFLEVSTDVNLLSANKSRRLSIQGSIDPYISSNPSHPSRSLLFLGQHTYGFDPNHWKWVLENFKLLRMLNFGCVDLYSIPTRIEDLIHLRYLSVESDALKAIPASIGKLINLETLDFRGTFVTFLPKEIWKLPRLVNLYMSGPVSFLDYLDPNDIAPENLRVRDDRDGWENFREGTALDHLLVLSTVSLNLKAFLPIDSGWFRNLTKLGIWFASDENNSELVDVLKCLAYLRRLQTLKIINCSERPCLPISFPETITKITLRHVRVKVCVDMKVLGKLPNLQILKLQSCLLSKLHVFAGSFHRLQVLKLTNLRIKKWKQRKGAMQNLKHLVITRCNELTMLPLNRLDLATLRDVEVLWSTSVSAKMIQELQMKVGSKLVIYPPLTDNLHEKRET